MLKILGILAICVAAMMLFYAASFGAGYALGYILPGGEHGGTEVQYS